GTPGAPGNVVLSVLDAPGFEIDLDGHSASSLPFANQVLITRMLADPGAYFVRIATKPSSGALPVLTAPLAAESPRSFAVLADTGTDHHGLPGRAYAQLWGERDGTIRFEIECANPASTDASLTGAVVHDPGSSALLAYYDLFSAPPSSQSVVGNVRKGRLPLFDTQLARFLARSD